MVLTNSLCLSLTENQFPNQTLWRQCFGGKFKYFNSQQKKGVELDIANAMAMDRVIVVYEYLLLQIRRITYSNVDQIRFFNL